MKMRLDEAIDRVAARMTAVEEDAALALRIVSSLPARSGWSLHWLLPRLAVGTLAALILAVVLRPFYDRSTVVLRTEVASAPAAASNTVVEPPSNDRRTAVEPVAIVRRTTVELPSNALRTEEDHQFSLAAIAAPEALSVGVVDPVDLPADDALAIAPLVIAELPLTAELSPR